MGEERKQTPLTVFDARRTSQFDLRFLSLAFGEHSLLYHFLQHPSSPSCPYFRPSSSWPPTTSRK